MANYNSIIKNYGLYWNKDEVKWKEDKQLLGYRDKDKDNPIDFHKQIGIYILYSDYKMIYVGKAEGDGGLFSRLNSHNVSRSKGPRWNQFSWFGLLEADDNSKKVKKATKENIESSFSEAIKSIEALLIVACEPHLNKQKGIWGDAIRYYQVPSKNEKSDSDRLKDIEKMLEKLTQK